MYPTRIPCNKEVTLLALARKSTSISCNPFLHITYNADCVVRPRTRPNGPLHLTHNQHTAPGSRHAPHHAVHLPRAQKSSDQISVRCATCSLLGKLALGTLPSAQCDVWAMLSSSPVGHWISLVPRHLLVP